MVENLVMLGKLVIKKQQLEKGELQEAHSDVPCISSFEILGN